MAYSAMAYSAIIVEARHQPSQQELKRWSRSSASGFDTLVSGWLGMCAEGGGAEVKANISH